MFSETEPPQYYDFTIIPLVTSAAAAAATTSATSATTADDSGRESKDAVAGSGPAQEWTVRGVARLGGDNAILQSEGLEFHTETFLVDEEAQDFVRHYFPKLWGRGRQVIVCQGEIVLLDVSHATAPHATATTTGRENGV